VCVCVCVHGCDELLAVCSEVMCKVACRHIQSSSPQKKKKKANRECMRIHGCVYATHRAASERGKLAAALTGVSFCAPLSPLPSPLPRPPLSTLKGGLQTPKREEERYRYTFFFSQVLYVVFNLCRSNRFLRSPPCLTLVYPCP
jgi:hypothetical protein